SRTLAFIPLIAPFPDISMHVTQTPGVRLLQSNLVDESCHVLWGESWIPEPRILTQQRLVVTKRVFRLRSRSTGIFPLGFGWKRVIPIFGQATGALFLSRQLITKRQRIVMADVTCCVVGTFFRRRDVCAGARAHARPTRPGTRSHEFLPLS